MGYCTDGLTFNTLRGGNVARLKDFRNRKGEIAHASGDGSDWSPAQWLQAVVGELGEYANLMKKVERGDLTMKEAREELGKELADVIVYLDILSFRLGIDLGRAVMDKFNEVSERVGSRVYLDHDDWHLKSETK